MDKERLTKLANHLISGQASSKFWYGSICNCAINETAQLFDDEALKNKMKEWSDPREFNPEVLNRINNDIRAFFFLTKQELNYLFYPIESNLDEYLSLDKVNFLSPNAKAVEVGKLIANYVKTGEFLVRTEEEISDLSKGTKIENDVDKFLESSY